MSTGEAPAARASPASILVGVPRHSLVLVESWAGQTCPIPPVPILAPHEPSLSNDVSPPPSWLERWHLGLADQEVGFRRRTRGHELPSLASVATGSGAKSRGICLRKGQTIKVKTKKGFAPCL